MNHRTATVVMLLIIPVSLLCSLGQKDDDTSISILTTTSIITDVVKQVAGPDISVTGLISRGQDPHTYEPTPRDMARAETADILFTNGFDLEENLLQVLKNIAEGTIVEVSASVPPLEYSAAHEEKDQEEDEAEYRDEHHHENDPHTWMSPLNVVRWVDVIEKTLTEADPEHTETYRQNAEQYREDLLLLHTSILEQLRSIPDNQKQFITDHNVYGHFARDYGFTVIGSIIPAVSTNADISSRELAELIETVRATDIRLILLGTTASDSIRKLSYEIQSALGRSVSIVNVLTGTLAPEGEEGDSYIGFIQYNADQIIRGIQEK